jgi:hypothetical protein
MADKVEVELKVPFKYARMWPREVFYRQLRELKPVVYSGCWEGGESGELIKCRRGHSVCQKHMRAHEASCKKLPETKIGQRTKWLYKTIDLLARSGVYVLYRDDVPYYVGQAGMLRSRLAAHARVPGSRYFNHWTHFSAFDVDKRDLNRIEAILIAAMPTANGLKPLKREPFPPELTEMVNAIYRANANPPFDKEETDEDEL